MLEVVWFPALQEFPVAVQGFSSLSLWGHWALLGFLGG